MLDPFVTFRLRQLLDGPYIEDVAAAVRAQLAALPLADQIRPGQTVAVTAGSRGIANIVCILRTIVDHLKQLGASPFLVPAMGSHGGATAEGQRHVLESYGITPQTCGCEVRSSMETVVVGTTPEGMPIHTDRHAYEADHIFLCGRIKPHTGFTGSIESGLTKMLLIGLGKHQGAVACHRFALDYGFGRLVERAAPIMLKKCRLVAGLAIVEQARGRTSLVEAIRPGELLTRESELLVRARQSMAWLPFDAIDLLIVDEIGKNISGTGMDTNVIGRKRSQAESDARPRIKRILVRGLSAETCGNATGIGLADFCRTRAIEQADFHATRINCLASNDVEGARIPIDFATDRDALAAALQTIGLVEPAQARIVWIRNTSELEEMECSVAYLDEAQRRENLEVVQPPRAIAWDAAGNLPGVDRCASI